MSSHLTVHDLRTPLAAGAAALVTALLATGCDTTSTAAANEPEFTTVRFTLGARGGIQLSGESRAAVRSVGAYSVSGGHAHRFARSGDQLLVVLRHWPEARTDRASRGRAPRLRPPEESSVETGFLVDTAQGVRANLDGHPVQWLRRDTVRIDTTNSALGDLTQLTLSAPRGGRSGKPAPAPGGCAGLDPLTDRRVVLPAVEPGAPVEDAVTRLRRLCLDVQYASLPGGAPSGTTRRILVPLAGQPVAAAAVPPLDGAAVPGRSPGDSVLADPSRPATVVVAR